MPKLPIITPRKAIQKLKHLGFIEDHQTGSHKVLYNSQTRKRAVVPFHLKTLPKGTLGAILRESGINRDEFIKA